MSEAHTCQHLVSSLSDYVDGELSPALCAELEKHLSDCENCRIVVNTLRKTIELYHETPSSDHLPSDIRQRLFHRLNLEDFYQEENL